MAHTIAGRGGNSIAAVSNPRFQVLIDRSIDSNDAPLSTRCWSRATENLCSRSTSADRTGTRSTACASGVLSMRVLDDPEDEAGSAMCVLGPDSPKLHRSDHRQPGAASMPDLAAPMLYARTWKAPMHPVPSQHGSRAGDRWSAVASKRARRSAGVSMPRLHYNWLTAAHRHAVGSPRCTPRSV